MYNFRITYDKNEIANYSEEKRLWQGIPSIEYTENGTTFVCFYSGETTETLGNYVLLYKSKDGVNFNQPIAIALPEEGYRCFDSTLWIDPMGRLWWMWAQSPDKGTYGVICNDPEAESPTFGEPFYIGRDVMMCRPAVLSTGEWLFPIAVWARFDTPDYPVPSGAYAYVTNDCGKTFIPRGFSKLDKRLFDEHMFVEHEHKVSVYVRTTYGIASSDSYDGGKTWIGDKKFKTGASSRFFIRYLPSGRLLLIYHDSPNSRNKLTAFLSEDGGETWRYKLMLDDRERLSYPDAKLDKNGYIHIVYDRDRGCSKKTLSENQSCAREILTACITEDDIIAG
ncbi:MAG: exo-alpha-sialidase, partial [Clostridia bacterium]|nr:exo-alpha-sialidase [Clostridia bacterium]